MFKDYFSKIKNGLPSHIHLGRGLGLDIDMRRDWKILCAIFLLIVFLILIVDLYIFYFNSDRPAAISEGQATDNSLSLDMERLDKTVSDWQGREDRFNKVLEKLPKVVDPAL